MLCRSPFRLVVILVVLATAADARAQVQDSVSSPAAYSPKAYYPPPRALGAESSFRAQLSQLDAQALQLNRTGRVHHFYLKTTLGYVLLGAGVGVAGAGAILFTTGLYAKGSYQSDDESSPSNRFMRTTLAMALAGIPVLGIGLGLLAHVKYGNHHRDEVAAVRAEKEQLRRDYKRARKARRRYSLAPTLDASKARSLGVRFGLSF